MIFTKNLPVSAADVNSGCYGAYERNRQKAFNPISDFSVFERIISCPDEQVDEINHGAHFPQNEINFRIRKFDPFYKNKKAGAAEYRGHDV